MKYWDDDMMADAHKMPYYEDGMYYQHHHHGDCGHMVQDEPEMVEDDCCAPKIKCTPTKECVKTFTSCYKLYRICHYKLYKVCHRCGHEFEYHHHQGMCPKCR